MKKIAMVCSIFVLLFTYSCDQQEGTILIDDAANNPETNLKAHSHGDDCEATTVTLTAGQHIDAGTVSVSNDDTTLYVTYTTSGDWVLEETHLYVGDEADIPLNGGGNPVNGHFTYQETHDGIQSYTYEVSLADLGDCFAVITHAVVNKVVNGEIVQSETAFGCGDKTFPGNRWGCYFEYCKQDCEDACMPAVAFHDGCGFCTDDDGFVNEFAPGFLATWGFALIDLYAEVDDCDISGATKVGFVKISFADANNILAEYFIFDGYAVCEVSLYADHDGNAPNDTNSYYAEYETPTSTPASFTLPWSDLTQNIFIKGGATIVATP